MRYRLSIIGRPVGTATDGWMSKVMTLLNRPLFGSAGAAILGGLASGAHAQGDWPTHWSLMDEGLAAAPGQVEALLSGRMGVFDIGGAATGAGYVFTCGPGETVAVFFDNGFSAREQGGCVIEGSRICFGSDPDGDCFEVRFIPSDPTPYLTFAFDQNELEVEDIEFFGEIPAIRLGLLPASPDVLLDAKGLMDFGPVAFTLPESRGYGIRQGSGFPLGLTFGASDYGGFRVQTEILGWPDVYSLPEPGRLSDGIDYETAKARLAAWEDGYRARDLGGLMGSTYEMVFYDARPLDLPQGPCVRIREDIGVVQAEGGIRINPSLTSYVRQACIDLEDGAFIVITTALNDPKGETGGRDFETASEEILDTIRLGYGSER